MDILIFGIQGSGKGTQAKLLAEKFGMKIFETGAELRKLAATDTELGQSIKKTIEGGHLVSDEIVIDIVKNFLTNLDENRPILFDGIPRTVKQQKLFNDLLSANNRTFKALYIDVPEEETLKRLIARGRHDDYEESIRNRFTAFYRDTKPIIDEYFREGKMISINGNQSIEVVKSEIEIALTPYYLKAYTY